ncbi:MAG: hypothetical protein ABW215_05505 [Kibdelosporangium sp.]
MIRLLIVELEPDDDPETRALARALRDSGVEVVYAKAATAEQIAHAAIQEDVRAVGLVVRTDAHRRIAAQLAAEPIAGPSTGTVVFATAEGDEPALRQSGVKAVFPFQDVEAVVTWVNARAVDHVR